MERKLFWSKYLLVTELEYERKGLIVLNFIIMYAIKDSIWLFM